MALRTKKPATTALKATTRRKVSRATGKVEDADTKPAVRIFVSYSHQDAAARTKLETHLAPWKREDVTVWYDGNMEPGASLDPEIARELRKAHIFVALFSPAYLASHYCWDIEYKRAMGRRARKLVRVVGVVVKPCGWRQTPAAGFKLLPEDGREPERWSSADAAYVNIAKGIGEVIKAVRRELSASGHKRASPRPKPTVVRAKLSAAGKPAAKQPPTRSPKPASRRARPRKP